MLSSGVQCEWMCIKGNESGALSWERKREREKKMEMKNESAPLFYSLVLISVDGFLIEEAIVEYLYQGKNEDKRMEKAFWGNFLFLCEIN